MFSCILQGFELHYVVNFLGHFTLTQHLLPSLLERQPPSPPK
jgi:NAD(P)-dependent dehydrogenase (short-subunit alcohol dehydrogenase family)